MRSSLVSALVATAALVLAAPLAIAHGNDQPQHGGLVKTSGETVVELVIGTAGADVYLREEVDELKSARLSGKIVVMKDGARNETPLVPAGGNRLTAKGATIAPGSRVSVQIVLADGVTKIGANYAIP